MNQALSYVILSFFLGLNDFNKGANIDYCQQPELPNEIKIPSGDSLNKGLMHWSCSDLFSEKAPKLWTKQRNDQWFPFCTPVRVQEMLSQNSNQENAYRNSRKFLNDCIEVKADRFDKAFVVTSEKPADVLSMTDEDKKSFEKKFLTVKGFVQKQCCKNHAGDCDDYFNDLKIRWCDATNPEDQKNNCLSVVGAFFDVNLEAIRKIDNYFNISKKTVFNEFKIPAVFVVVPPFKNKKNESLTAFDILVHETGHACSFYQEIDEIKKGSEDSYADFKKTHFYNHCILTKTGLRVYKNRFKEQGMSEESIDCIVSTVLNSEKKSKTSPNCRSACFRGILEESYAQWIFLNAVIEEDTIGSKAVDSFCGYGKDSFHSYGAQDMACFLKTPAFRNKMEKLSGCSDYLN